MTIWKVYHIPTGKESYHFKRPLKLTEVEITKIKVKP